VVDEDCLICVNALMDCLVEEGEPLNELDMDGDAWVHLLSSRESEGSLRVCISSLLPRTMVFVEEDWDRITANGKDPAMP
jgi:hypothetical protein